MGTTKSEYDIYDVFMACFDKWVWRLTILIKVIVRSYFDIWVNTSIMLTINLFLLSLFI